ncbi:MAG: FtsX-like permease family protein [Rikenella sp.]|nr:FtsX-like permease family protein [Rikenella sp.]
MNSFFRTYIQFLKRNKLYTSICLFGFAISLMFVIVLGFYVKQELSVDTFHTNADRIYLFGHDRAYTAANPVGPYLKERYPQIENFVRATSLELNVEIDPQTIIRIQTAFVDSSFFEVFSFGLEAGEASQVLIPRNSVVISRAFANRFYAGTDPVGNELLLYGQKHVITGVMSDIPHHTHFPKVDLIVNYNSLSLFQGQNVLQSWGNSSFALYLLERQGADLQGQKQRITEDLKRDYWLFKDGFSQNVRLVPLKEVYFLQDTIINSLNIRTNSRTLVLIYLGVALLILIVSMINYVNLTVAQTGFRAKEIAIRRLMGCSTKRLLMQMTIESMVMTIVAFLLAILLVSITKDFFGYMLSTDLQQTFEITSSVFVISFLSVLGVGILAGLIPAMEILRIKPIQVVKRTFQFRIKTIYSGGFMVFQYAVCIGLLGCSLTMLRQSHFLIHHDVGFNTNRIVVLENVLWQPSSISAFKSRLHQIPEIEEVSLCQGNPVNMNNNMSFSQNGEPKSTLVYFTDSAFFSVFGIDIEPTGHPFSQTNFYINHTGLAHLVWDSTSYTFGMNDANGYGIAGIMNDFNMTSLYTPIKPLLIGKLTDQEIPSSYIIKMHASVDLYETAKKIKTVYSEFANNQPADLVFADREIANRYTAEKKLSRLMITFTTLTGLILIMGIFAMSLYLVRQRAKEIAIRKVNGATIPEILWMLNYQVARKVCLAFIIATPIAMYFMNKWLQNFAYRINLGWGVFLLSGVIVLLVTSIITTLQSWKTTRQDPVLLLKNE